MTADTLVDDHVSSAQALKALKALHAYATKKQAERDANALLPGRDEHVWLVVGTKVMHPEKKLKPHRIPLKHPLVDPRETRICLITKDPQREYKDLLATNNVNFVSRVVGLTKLKGKFRGFDARRALLEENGLFLADERVVPLLPRLLGSKFFQAKKQPIPVSLTTKHLKHELERAVSSTYFHQNQGTCTSVKLGALNDSFPAEKLLDNFTEALPPIVEAIKGGWDNIQSLHVKTSSSASLPVWTCELGDRKGGRWDGLTVETEEKGKKRVLSDSDDEDDVDEQPKKTKSSTAPSSSTVKISSSADANVETPPKKKRKHDADVDLPASSKKSQDDSTTPTKKVKDSAPHPVKKAKDDGPVSAKKVKDDNTTPAKKVKHDASTPAKKIKDSTATPAKKNKDGAATPAKSAKDDVPTPAKKAKDDTSAASAKKSKDAEAPKSAKVDATPSKPKADATATPAKKEKKDKATGEPSEKTKSAATPKDKSTVPAVKPKSTPSVSSPAPPKSALKSALKSPSSSAAPAVEKHTTFAVTPADLKAKKSAAAGGATSKKDKVIASNAKGKERKAALVGKEKRR